MKIIKAIAFVAFGFELTENEYAKVWAPITPILGSSNVDCSTKIK